MPTYFISEQFLNEEILGTSNVDSKSVYPYIRPSTDTYLKPILRQKDKSNTFYDYLLAAYIAQTLTPDEIILVDLIKYALGWRTASNAVIYLASQITNKGPQIQSSDNSNSVDSRTLYYQKNMFEKFAEQYQQELVDYLKLHHDLFPQFIGFECCSDDDQFECGIAIY